LTFPCKNYVPIPEDKSKDYISVPSSIDESYNTGIKAERENIDMYDRFLSEYISPYHFGLVFKNRNVQYYVKIVLHIFFAVFCRVCAVILINVP